VQGYAEDFIACPADLLIANIHFDVMKKLIADKAGSFASKKRFFLSGKAGSFASNKRFILSGLLRSEAKQVRIELERLSAKIIKSWTHEGIWHTFYGEIAN
jgi:ribosomal protein L11 methyltransferase